jgi:hypothetical protein
MGSYSFCHEHLPSHSTKKGYLDLDVTDAPPTTRNEIPGGASSLSLNSASFSFSNSVNGSAATTANKSARDAILIIALVGC